tara:strand:+ start:150 stop:461 length:312 start_codon:yes stop_codon:yes gene_type:complete
MKVYVNEHMFRDRFMQSDNYYNKFSYKGLTALFEYIEELEDDCGEEIEFDMIALCCDYSEYDDLDDFDRDYSKDGKVYTMDEIREETVVIEIPDTERFIIGVF